MIHRFDRLGCLLHCALASRCAASLLYLLPRKKLRPRVAPSLRAAPRGEGRLAESAARPGARTAAASSSRCCEPGGGGRASTRRASRPSGHRRKSVHRHLCPFNWARRWN